MTGSWARRLFPTLCGLAVVGLGTAAEACRGPTLEQSIFYSAAPLWAPAGESILKVRLTHVTSAGRPVPQGRCYEACAAEAEVLAVTRGRDPGRRVVMDLGWPTSCGPWADVGAEGYIRGELQTVPDGRVFVWPRSESPMQRMRRERAGAQAQPPASP